MITIVSVSMSGFIIVSITACIFLKRRPRSQNGRPKRKCKRDVENLLLQHGSLAPKRYRYLDIKPHNILLDDDLCPKISDFGLAKFCKKRQSVLSMLGTRGTAGYIAPEVFSRNFGAVSHKSDVYSYGMMLLEMAGAKRNVVVIEEIQSTSENYFPGKIYESMMIEEEGEEEEEGKRKMMLVGFWCIQTIPSERPSMSKVVEMLEGSIGSIQIPPKPYLFSTAIPHHQQTSSSTSSFSPIERWTT